MSVLQKGSPLEGAVTEDSENKGEEFSSSKQVDELGRDRMYRLENEKSKVILEAFRMKYELAQKGEWWWIFDDSLAEIGAQLSQSNYVVIDKFLGDKLAKSLFMELKKAHLAGELPETKQIMIGCPRMQQGSIGGLAGSTLAYKVNKYRDDYIAWFTGKEKPCNWKNFPILLQRLDTLVSELERFVPELKGFEMNRSNAMATCYPGKGARYIRHCDNTSKISNGRVVTVIYYANPKWKRGSGGELRIYEPAGAVNGPESQTKPTVDIEPLLDRVVVFFSDERVPHEVLPAHLKRYAVTLWYFNKKERELSIEKDRNFKQCMEAVQNANGNAKKSSHKSLKTKMVEDSDCSSRISPGNKDRICKNHSSGRESSERNERNNDPKLKQDQIFSHIWELD